MAAKGSILRANRGASSGRVNRITLHNVKKSANSTTRRPVTRRQVREERKLALLAPRKSVFIDCKPEDNVQSATNDNAAVTSNKPLQIKDQYLRLKTSAKRCRKTKTQWATRFVKDRAQLARLKRKKLWTMEYRDKTAIANESEKCRIVRNPKDVKTVAILEAMLAENSLRLLAMTKPLDLRIKSCLI